MKHTYEMNPCRRDGDNFEKCAESAPDIATWSVYRRGEDGLAEWLNDHETKAAAEAEVARLQSSENAKPHPVGRERQPDGTPNHTPTNE